MNSVKIIDVTNSTEVFSSSFMRLGTSEGRIAIMFDGGIKKELNALKSNKLYKITISQNNETLIDSLCTFVSYNFTYMTTNTLSDEMVVGDNSVLFSILE